MEKVHLPLSCTCFFQIHLFQIHTSKNCPKTPKRVCSTPEKNLEKYISYITTIKIKDLWNNIEWKIVKLFIIFSERYVSQSKAVWRKTGCRLHTAHFWIENGLQENGKFHQNFQIIIFSLVCLLHYTYKKLSDKTL